MESHRTNMDSQDEFSSNTTTTNEGADYAVEETTCKVEDPPTACKVEDPLTACEVEDSKTGVTARDNGETDDGGLDMGPPQPKRKRGRNSNPYIKRIQKMPKKIVEGSHEIESKNRQKLRKRTVTGSSKQSVLKNKRKALKRTVEGSRKEDELKSKQKALKRTFEDSPKERKSKKQKVYKMANEESVFSVGDYIIAKEDLKSSSLPHFWRVDRKGLLELFVAYQKRRKLVYCNVSPKNVSSYLGYTRQDESAYMKINVQPVTSWRGRIEVVWLNYEEMKKIEWEDDESSVPEQASDYPSFSSFQIYLQALISKSIMDCFLTDVYKDNDTYFISNIDTIDVYNEQKKKHLLDVMGWKNRRFLESLRKWPHVTLFKLMVSAAKRKCHACGKEKLVFYRVIVDGRSYDSKTMLQGHTHSSGEKWNVCDDCAGAVELYSNLFHLKFKVLEKCTVKVDDVKPMKNLSDEDMCNLLEKLLRDGPWIYAIWSETKKMWSKVDAMKKS